MKVSYAVTYKDEMNEMSNLLGKLKRSLADVDYEYEVVILQDNTPTVPLRALLPSRDYKLVWREFDNDFSAHKNYLNSQCTGDYIFQIDADEYPSSVLVQFIGSILEANKGTDLIWVPRVNTVSGITTEHLMHWGWRAEVLEGVELMAINWPDYQSRCYRNDPKIRWVNKVHEHIEGADRYTRLPAETIWALFHEKTIKKQEAQNRLYSTMVR